MAALFEFPLAISSAPLEKCPPYSVGLLVTDTEYISTASAEPLSFNDESIEIAFSRAKIESRNLLVNRVRALVGDAKKISGAIETHGCRDSKSVYVTTKISKDSITQSRRLKDVIGESLRSNPTPQLD